MKNFYVIGVMSGTSLDGVDFVYVKFTKNDTWSFKIINSKTYKYEDSITKFLIDISKKGIEEIKKIDIEYFEFFSETLRKLNHRTYLNYIVDKIDPSFMSDAVHLNKLGAEKYSEIIKKEIDARTHNNGNE